VLNVELRGVYPNTTPKRKSDILPATGSPRRDRDSARGPAARLPRGGRSGLWALGARARATAGGWGAAPAAVGCGRYGPYYGLLRGAWDVGRGTWLGLAASCLGTRARADSRIADSRCQMADGGHHAPRRNDITFYNILYWSIGPQGARSAFSGCCSQSEPIFPVSNLPAQHKAAQPNRHHLYHAGPLHATPKCYFSRAGGFPKAPATAPPVCIPFADAFQRLLTAHRKPGFCVVCLPAIRAF
jgi:hypothetical protein